MNPLTTGGLAQRKLAFWELAAPVYDGLTRMARWDRHTALLAEEIRPVLFGAEAHVVDVGTGPGTSAGGLARALPDARILGLDASRAMLRIGARRLEPHPALAARIDWILADAGALPLPSASADAVTGQSLLYLLPDRRRAMAEFARVLRPGGRAVLLEPRAGRRFGHLKRLRDPGHVITMTAWRTYSAFRGRFEPAALAQLATDAGLEVIAVRAVLDDLCLLLVADKP